MWETLQNNADWDYFKTLTSREILKIQNLLQGEHCVFSEATRLFQSAGCVRNIIHFRTVTQFSRIRNHFVGCRILDGPYTRTWFVESDRRGTSWKDASEQPRTELGENSKLGMSLCTSWKRIILICVCGWHKICWKETKSWSDVESTQSRSWFGRTNIFLWSFLSGMHSTTMPNKQRYCRQLQNHVRIANFRGWNRKTAISSKSSYFFMVLWYGVSCKEMCGAILWVGS